jgi:hypothetical protein
VTKPRVSDSVPRSIVVVHETSKFEKFMTVDQSGLKFGEGAAYLKYGTEYSLAFAFGNQEILLPSIPSR